MRLKSPGPLLVAILLARVVSGLDTAGAAGPDPAILATTLTVPGDANLFGSGHVVPPVGCLAAGQLPPGTTFAAAPGQVLVFSSVTGQVTMTTPFGLNGPDGSTAHGGANINSLAGISGIRQDGVGFLAGVFLGPDEPSGTPPSTLDFRGVSIGTSFATLCPGINQIFFIGDGLTGTGAGAKQLFLVPEGATRLFLGFADACSYAGVPGAYQDNSGSLTATFTIATPSVSVPATANIYGSGHASNPVGCPGAGERPPFVQLNVPAGTPLQLAGVVGSITATSAFGLHDADGDLGHGGSNINPLAGLSGFLHDGSGSLVGVYVGGAEPANPPPPTLDFRSTGLGTGFTTLSAALNQVFFIGDGLTGSGTGSPQSFVVPAGAVRLYLGLADACSYLGNPGAYQDNSGSVQVSFLPTGSCGALVAAVGSSDSPSPLRLWAVPGSRGFRFRLAVPSAGHVQLSIFDVAGRQRARLLDEERAGGDWQIPWDGTGTGGAPLPAGIYWARLHWRDETTAAGFLVTP